MLFSFLSAPWLHRRKADNQPTNAPLFHPPHQADLIDLTGDDDDEPRPARTRGKGKGPAAAAAAGPSLRSSKRKAGS